LHQQLAPIFLTVFKLIVELRFSFNSKTITTSLSEL
jgi:hypothetical protein